MPRMRKRGVRRKVDLAERTKQQLLSGHDYSFLDGPELDESGLQEVYEQHADSIEETNRKERGELTRSWAFWRFVAVPRFGFRKPGSGPGEPYPHYRHDGSFGIPPNCDREEFEGEASYLARNGLLSQEDRNKYNRNRNILAKL
jgi:hypothetical protein